MCLGPARLPDRPFRSGKAAVVTPMMQSRPRRSSPFVDGTRLASKPMAVSDWWAATPRPGRRGSQERKMTRWKQLVAVALSGGFIAAANAQELKIGLSAEPSSMDPHFHNLAPNTSMMKHIFESCWSRTSSSGSSRGWRCRWRTVDDTTWEFKLRPGVKFTDGSDFTANDVIYSFCRVPQVENSPSSFAINCAAITGDDGARPARRWSSRPTRPIRCCRTRSRPSRILSAKANGAGAVTFDREGCKGVGTYPKTEAFNAGEAAIGTGPYKLVRYTRATASSWSATTAIWGDKPDWQRVIFRPITSAGPRVAALLAGDVDLIENVADPGPRSGSSPIRPSRSCRGSPTASSTCISTMSTSRRPASPTPTARTRSATRACARRSPRRSIATPSSRASWAAWRCRRASCCRRVMFGATRT